MATPCQLDLDFPLWLEGSCGDCSLGEHPGRSTSPQRLVPPGLCPSAYLAVVPYWLSFAQGAWFRWRQSKSDVICQCPMPDGVVLKVNKLPTGKPASVEVEVTHVGRTPCRYGHQSGQRFTLGKGLCPALSPGLLATLGTIREPVGPAPELRCCATAVSLRVRR